MKQKVRRVLVKPVPADELIAAVEALVPRVNHRRPA
jgi:DNA-binding response OmpR family regulator